MDEAWGPSVYGQARTYVDAVARAGGIPISIPILEDQKILRQLYEKVDAIVFSGGNDIDPEVYGEKQITHLESVLRRRDDQEILLCKWALEDRKPILAICRGMQLVNVALGGTLYQDIPTQLPDTEDHNACDTNQDVELIAHNITIDASSKLAKVLGTTHMDTNSRHHQAVKTLGEGLVETAWAKDGVIEGIELPGYDFVVCVQSHPEILESRAVTGWRKLFSAHVDAAQKRVLSLQAREPQAEPVLSAH